MNDTNWITECSREVARDAMDLLGEVRREMDLKSDPIVIADHPPISRLGWRDVAEEKRLKVARMLLLRGVLKHFEPQYVIGVYGREKAGIRIEADETTVRETHRLLMQHLYGSRPPAKPIGPEVKPIPIEQVLPHGTGRKLHPDLDPEREPDPYADDVKKTHRIERARLPYVVAATLIAAALLAGLKWGAQWWDAIAKLRNPAAAESTAVKVPAARPTPAKSPAAAESTKSGVDREAGLITG